MGVGLGENTPITFSQSRGNFEALIGRHGQWVRWRQSKKCPCVDFYTEQPDAHCEKCGGTGEVYSWQTTAAEIVFAEAHGGICDAGEKFEEATVDAVYSADGLPHEFFQQGRFVVLKSADENEIFEIHLTAPLEKTAHNVVFSKKAGGIFEAKALVAPKSAIEGVRHLPPCDITAVDGLQDEGGLEVECSDFRQNEIFAGETMAETLTAKAVRYVEPKIFAVLAQTGDKGDADFFHGREGEAQCTFPYKFAVGEGDIITVLAGSLVRKAAFEKRRGDDVLPDDFVEKIESVETKSRSFSSADFVLVGQNKIRWICESPPNEGETLSVVWRAFPTYRVMRELPQLRTSENQRQPRRATLKLMTAFSEARKIARN